MCTAMITCMKNLFSPSLEMKLEFVMTLLTWKTSSLLNWKWSRILWGVAAHFHVASMSDVSCHYTSLSLSSQCHPLPIITSLVSYLVRLSLSYRRQYLLWCSEWGFSLLCYTSNNDVSPVIIHLLWLGLLITSLDSIFVLSFVTFLPWFLILFFLSHFYYLRSIAVTGYKYIKARFSDICQGL